MKKIAAYLIAAAMILSLCSCVSAGDTDTVKNIDEKTSAADTSAAAVQTTAAIGEDPSYPDEWVPASGIHYIEDYVTTALKEWDCGCIEYPVFSEQTLYPEDAKAANALFEQVLASFEKNIRNEDELEENIGWGYVESSMYGNVLSVIMVYRYFYGDNPMGKYVKAVNFNLETGRAMTPAEVIEEGFYTEENVKDSLTWYVSEYITGQKKFEKLYEYYENGIIPDREPDGFNAGWSVKYALDSYGNEKDELTDLDENVLTSVNIPFYPAVYLDYAGVLYVEAKAADDTAGRVYNKMAAVGRDETDISLNNRRNYFDMLTYRTMLSKDGAVEAAYTYFNKTDGFDPDIYYNYVIDKIDCIYDAYAPDDKHIAYIIRVYAEEDGGTEDITVFAADMLENYMWEADDAGEWQFVYRSIIDYGDACDRNALGAVCLYPSEYDTFLADPLADAAVTSGEDYILVGALYAGTTVSILHGSRNDDGTFVSDDVLFQTNLNMGEWIRVYCPRITNDDASMAIEFATGFDRGTFVYSGTDHDIICYAFSDEAAG